MALIALGLSLVATPLLAAAQTQAQTRAPTAASTAAAGTPMTNYVIRRGDTLIDIGERYFTRPENWRRVQTINRVTNPYRLPIGGVLRIPTSFFRVATAGARVAAFQGPVAVVRAGQRSAPRVDQALAEGDVLETGPNAHLRLTLSDGGAVAVPSNTRMRVDRLRADVLTGGLDQSFSVLQGRIESRVAPVRNGGAYTVRTPVSVSAVRGTVYRTSFDADLARATAEVLEGEVDVDSGGGAASVTPGLGAVMGAAGLVVKALPPAPYLVEPDAPRAGAEVAFDIIPVPGAVAYRALVASDPALADVVAQAESASGETRVLLPPLPDGFHYLSLTAVSADGLEGPASVYDFLRARSEVRDLTVEPGSGAGGRRFLWASEGAAVPRYRFQLGRPGEPPLIDREGLSEPVFEVPTLAPGDYVWRVRVSRTVLGQLVDVWSDPQTLSVGP